MTTPPWPGPGRITLVLLAVVPAVLAYPWPSTRDRWILGVAVAALIVLLGWWRGLPFTTILRRRVAMLRRRGGAPTRRPAGADARATALLRVLAADTDPGELPCELIAGYLHRYGLRAEAIRVTSRDSRSAAGAPVRDTWIGLTLSAAANLAALQARSPLIPLQETAEVAARRLADHLREIGWEITAAGSDDVPDLFSPAARESWHGLTDVADDHVAAYSLDVDQALPETLAQVWAHDSREIWTAVEFAGTPGQHLVAAGCALRTTERPAAASPLAGLAGQHGNHRRALQALQPLSGQHLDGRTELPADVIAALHWPTAPGASADSAPRAPARHAAASRT